MAIPIPKKNAGPVISSGNLINELIPKIIPVTTDIQKIITIIILRLNFTFNNISRDGLTRLRYNNNLKSLLLKWLELGLSIFSFGWFNNFTTYKFCKFFFLGAMVVQPKAARLQMLSFSAPTPRASSALPSSADKAHCEMGPILLGFHTRWRPAFVDRLP